jgi:hypothetical protein
VKLPTYKLILLALLPVLTLINTAPAQSLPGADQAPQIDPARQGEIIDSICFALNEIYVFPDVAEKMEIHVRKRLKDGVYDTITNAAEFAYLLSQDLQEISRDRHLGVRWFTDAQLAEMPGDSLTDEDIRRMTIEGRYNNWGFEKLERLDGNVGYLKLNQFADASLAGGTAIAAMNFLANCDALIFDLRDNGGGSPSMIQLMSSYLFDEPMHLNSFYIRQEDTTKQFWTQAYVQGPKMVDADIYVLTSDYTFSGAEEFTYNLKNMERATIVGETTGGGAHPIEGRVFANLNIGMSLPFGRAVNPITGTNWEGTGVEPHISVPSAQALDRAYAEAIQKLLDDTADPERREILEWTKATLDRKLNPLELDPHLMRSYAGRYGPRTITFENEQLFYQREGRPKYQMIPFTRDTFMFDEIDYFRLKVVKNEEGEITHLQGIYRGGRTDITPKGDS